MTKAVCAPDADSTSAFWKGIKSGGNETLISDCGVHTADIDLPNPRPGRKDGVWMGKIQCHGSTEAEAIGLRDAVLYAINSLIGSQATQPAEMTDAEIDALCLSLTGFMTRKERDRAVARAILALRPVQVPMTDEVREQALDMLATLFDAYENGTACYESPDDCAGYLGNAVQIDHDTFHVIASLLNTHRPTINPGITAQAKKE